MNMSFQEKSIWISLVVTTIIFGYYFVKAFDVFLNPFSNNPGLVSLLMGVVILTIIVEIILQTILSIFSKKEASAGNDERDKIIKFKSFRISYFILIFGAWVAVISLLVPKSTTLFMANIIIFFSILSELFGFVTQLIYYRRGV